jgi:hypothetical protein
MNKATQSKINYTAVVISMVNIVAALGYIPDAIRVEVVTLTNTLGPMAIVVFRTWYTGDK